MHHWELGNEPDVDPDLVPPDSIFGCWGEISDREYYGGKEYGNMLKLVYPAINSPILRQSCGWGACCSTAR